MKLHELKPAEGSKRPAKRMGRGIAGKGGKTAGRGTKGQHARNTVKPGFEGGQTPLHRRTPKSKGFKNPFRVEYNVVNLDALEDFAAGTVVKVLGRGEISNSLTVKAHRFSDSAKAAIEAAGGTTELIALPWGDRRPPAKGNALTNR
jgi:large subunit ribosomal protein L15